VLEPRSVGAERLHYPLALGQLALRVDVGLDRAVVEERDKQKRADRTPTAQNDGLPSERTRVYLQSHVWRFQPSSTCSPLRASPASGSFGSENVE
jgi:hypothetical protein